MSISINAPVPMEVANKLPIGCTQTQDETLYLFRKSGGSNNANVGNRLLLNKIVGGTVAWNQLVSIPTSDKSKTENGVTITDNRDGSYSVVAASGATGNVFLNIGSVSIIKDHKYLFTGTPSGGGSSTYYSYAIKITSFENKQDYGNGYVAKATATDSVAIIAAYVKSGTIIATAIKFRPQLFDLTAMFGSAIENYAYTLESNTAGAGVAWLKSYGFFPKPYYPYAAANLQSVKTSAHRTVGFNQFDKSKAVVGSINSSGNVNPSDTLRRVSDWIRVVPNTTYYVKDVIRPVDGRGVCFYNAAKEYIGTGKPNNSNYASSGTITTTNDTGYIRLGIYVANVDTACLSLHWDGERDGEYEAYQSWNYPLDSDLKLRGIPRLDANNNLYYDGDTYAPDGTVTRKYGIVTFDGSNDESWTLNTTTEGNAIFQITISGSVSTVNDNNDLRTRCDKLAAYPAYPLTRSGRPTNACGLVSNSRLFVILPSASVADVTALRTWLGTNNLAVVYELATPTTESADPYEKMQIVSKDGTEQFVDAGERDIEMPVQHETVYPIPTFAEETFDAFPMSVEESGTTQYPMEVTSQNIIVN